MDKKACKVVSIKSLKLMFGKTGLFPTILSNIIRIMRENYNLKKDDYKKITAWWYMNKDNLK